MREEAIAPDPDKMSQIRMIQIKKHEAGTRFLIEVITTVGMHRNTGRNLSVISFGLQTSSMMCAGSAKSSICSAGQATTGVQDSMPRANLLRGPIASAKRSSGSWRTGSANAMESRIASVSRSQRRTIGGGIHGPLSLGCS